MKEEITLSGLRIFRNGWTHLGCDSFLCNQSPTTWGVGVPDGPPGQHQHFCEADMQELVANIPDELLPAVGAMVIRHVSEGTEWGQALVEKIAEALPDAEAPVDIPTGAVDPEDVETHERLHGELLRSVESGSPSLTEDAGGETPVNAEAGHSCVCGWEPKNGSANPEGNLRAHQRFCEAAKAEKGDG